MKSKTEVPSRGNILVVDDEEQIRTGLISGRCCISPAMRSQRRQLAGEETCFYRKLFERKELLYDDALYFVGG